MNSEDRIRTGLPQRSAFSFCRAALPASGRATGARSCGWGACGVRVAAIFIVLLLCASGSFAYSVLTHEEIVDLVWTDELRPLLLQRFPGLTEDQITEAHGYAYGGAVIQDLGYYPLG